MKLACSDTCCDGLKKPEEHVIKKLFPGMSKWPLADAFHKVQIGTDSMVAGHEYYADAARYGILNPVNLDALFLRVVERMRAIPAPCRHSSFFFPPRSADSTRFPLLFLILLPIPLQGARLYRRGAMG